MRKLIVSVWMTLDGFVAGLNDEMDWLLVDEAMNTYENNLIRRADTLLLGRATYQGFAGHWPKVAQDPTAAKEEVAYAQQVNAMRKIVFSKTLKHVEWTNSRRVEALRPEEIRGMKQEPGRDIVIYGSLSIVRTLMQFGLIDEYQLLVHPVVLGSGKPLWPNMKEKMALKRVQTQMFPSGVVLLSYQPIK
ncbi:MAG: dihydrofolate reductase [Ktedonobacteraceae bacterium]|nr:dihydrofolate reductase [Ktedonobacteraceae bacterium]